MKRTEEDQRFAARFAEALAPFVAGEREKGRSWAQIALDLGVTAAGLQKQLAGGTPSIRTIALAHSKYGLSVPYEGVEISKAITSRKRGKSRRGAENQLLLPFDIIAPVSSKALILRRAPFGIRRYRLQLVIAK
jgi:hypothetical protein